MNRKNDEKEDVVNADVSGLPSSFVRDMIEYNRVASKTHLWGTIIAIVTGSIFCLSGFAITILGFSGSIDWIFECPAFKCRLGNAGPGVFFALLGMIILWRYRPSGSSSLESAFFSYGMQQSERITPRGRVVSRKGEGHHTETEKDNDDLT